MENVYICSPLGKTKNSSQNFSTLPYGSFLFVYNAKSTKTKFWTVYWKSFSNDRDVEQKVMEAESRHRVKQYPFKLLW